ncbi:MAG: endonuclease V [Actinomycetota bacterium]
MAERSKSLRPTTWADDPEGLIAIQNGLSAVQPEPWEPSGVITFGGCWVCFSRGIKGRGQVGEPAWAAAVLVQRHRLVARTIVTGKAGYAYEPGLMGLREGPLLEVVMRGLPRLPDCLLVNATGLDHPRRAGLALHLGAVLDVPTVGVTHRPLDAEGDQPGEGKGATAPLRIGSDLVGFWLRTRTGAKPLAVTGGWKVDPDTAVEAVALAVKRARTPEPLRKARYFARLARAGLL